MGPWKARYGRFLKIGSKCPIFTDSNRKNCELLLRYLSLCDTHFILAQQRTFKDKTLRKYTISHCKKITKILKSHFL